MRKIVGAIGVAIILAVFIAGFMAYFVCTIRDNVIHDGFGRPLSETPLLIRLYFEQDCLWAGWLWFIGDMVIFCGGFFIGVTLASWGFNESSSDASANVGNAFSDSKYCGHHT